MKSMAEWYQSAFETLEKSLNGEAQSELHAIRKKALTRFTELGFPTTRHEEWRFTNVAPVSGTPFNPVPAGRISVISMSEMRKHLLPDAHNLVFIDGHFVPSLSNIDRLPEGVIVCSLAEASRQYSALLQDQFARYAPGDENPFVALNTAFALDGAFVHVPDGIRIMNPVHVLFAASGEHHALIPPRNLFLVGRNAQVSLVESYVAVHDGVYFTNVVTELVAGKGSAIEHDKLQDESRSAYHIAWTHIVQQEQSTVTSNLIAVGGSIARSNVTVVLDAEGSVCTLNGLSLATGTQLIDNHTTIDHAKPHCESHELYKAILDGKSHGVFNGKIFVRKDAQKTDAKQTNQTLLLSDEAVMDTKPQLEIFADDVKCTHGATVGQLDADQIFYLRSRGLDLLQARDMLTFAFAADVVQRVHVSRLREQLESLIHARLHAGRITT
ncbi:MAG: Fe-S cluster assembly protein SufD [Ignavibacteriales bacterium]|nr:Fe-S cluster assembly protein SufD [Ignavibacteriales bacterium]